MRLDIGGGHAPAPGHINVDIVPEADIVWDLNKDLRLSPELMDKTNQVEGIRCHQVLEHLESIIPTMNACYELLKEEAQMEISTPLAGTTQAFQDPTHIHCYVPETFDYFSQNSPFAKEQKEYRITARFKIKKVEVLDKWNLNVTLEK